jgi:hypothetical protein
MEPEDISVILEIDRKISGEQRAIIYRDLLEEALGGIYCSRGNAVDIEMVGSEMVSHELATVLHGATRTIRGITVPVWAPDTAIVWESIKERISAGVAYRRLADEATFVSFGLWINQRDVQDVGVQLRLLPASHLRDKFFVVDDTLAFVFWRPSPGSPFSLDATKTTLDMFVRQCKDSFDALWDTAVPAQRLFGRMVEIRETFARRCRTVLGIEPFEGFVEVLVDYGKFCFSTENLRAQYSCHRAVEALRCANLIVRSPDGNGDIPNISEDVRLLIEDEMKNP